MIQFVINWNVCICCKYLILISHLVSDVLQLAIRIKLKDIQRVEQSVRRLLNTQRWISLLIKMDVSMLILHCEETPSYPAHVWLMCKSDESQGVGGPLDCASRAAETRWAGRTPSTHLCGVHVTLLESVWHGYNCSEIRDAQWCWHRYFHCKYFTVLQIHQNTRVTHWATVTEICTFCPDTWISIRT